MTFVTNSAHILAQGWMAVSGRRLHSTIPREGVETISIPELAFSSLPAALKLRRSYKKVGLEKGLVG